MGQETFRSGANHWKGIRPCQGIGAVRSKETKESCSVVSKLPGNAGVPNALIFHVLPMSPSRLEAVEVLCYTNDGECRCFGLWVVGQLRFSRPVSLCFPSFEVAGWPFAP